MAYLILSDRDGEFDRRELRGVTVIGRALDCSVCVRDILLSRKHCQIERFQDRWVIADCGSKNGTRVGNELITRHILSDGDVIRIGKIQVAFHTGAFVPPPKDQPQRRRDVRPTDPNEALSGTVLGFQLFDMEEDSRVSGFPIPKPKPKEPESLGHEAVHSMVSQIASTTWDAKATLSPTRARPLPAAAPVIEIPKEVVQRRQDIQRKARLIQTPSLPNPGAIPADSAAPSPTVPPAPVGSAPVVSASVASSAVAPSPAPSSILTIHHDPNPVEEQRRAPLLRSQDPNTRATIPGWLAGTYILLALVIGALSITAIVMRSILAHA